MRWLILLTKRNQTINESWDILPTGWRGVRGAVERAPTSPPTLAGGQSEVGSKGMAIGIIKFNHVNVTVPSALEAVAKDFYGTVLGLPEIPKPAGTRQGMGAWYELGDMQLHLSIEDDVQQRIEQSARLLPG